MDSRTAKQWHDFVSASKTDTIPHCDSLILHAPGECEYCDKHPDWQQRRVDMKIAFTGHVPTDEQEPCPADAGRPKNSLADHRRWAGNKPTSSFGNPDWPAESMASVVLYGDHGGRAPWPIAERLRLRVSSPIRRVKMRLRGWKRQGGLWTHR